MSRWKQIGSVLASASLGGLLLTSAASAACPDAGMDAGTQSEPALVQSVLCLVNEKRADAGRRPVRVNAQLGTGADRHAGEMVSEGYFSHTSPSGVPFIRRMRETGYIRPSRSWAVGENLGWGSQELSSPASLVAAWMQSPTHRVNLLSRRFREIGIAVVRGTPVDAGDQNGVTVASEYGFRGPRRAVR